MSEVIRLCFAQGPWQLVMLAASLRQAEANNKKPQQTTEYAVLYDPFAFGSEFKSAMTKVVHAVWNWKEVIWADDLLKHDINETGYSFNELQEKLRERLGVERPGEIWMLKLNEAVEKLIAETFTNAGITLYEDGTFIYTPFLLDKWRMDIPPRSLINVLKLSRRYLRYLQQSRVPENRWRRSGQNLYPTHVRRISRTYSYLLKDKDIPKWLIQVPLSPITDDVLRQTITACSSLFKSNTINKTESSSESPSVLLMGQNFARAGIITDSQELQCYTAAASAILEKGYKVLWKEHPRISQPLFPRLKQILTEGSIQEVDLPYALPIEIAAAQLNLCACVAVSSSSLFYLSRAYRIKSYTCLEYFIPYMAPSYAQMQAVFAGNFESIDDLPSAYESALGEPNEGGD